ncbi:MAG: hypothetical protein Q8Q12_09670 [bacterium]|nr:hypothetical protein [bacterium]
MKRGRPPVRQEFRREILEALGEGQVPYPLTASSVKRLLDARRLRPCGWHTVRRYLEELAGERLVLRQALPTQAGRKPLVVYMGRYPQDR